MKYLFTTISAALILVACNNVSSEQKGTFSIPTTVKIVGAMKNVMWKGELQGTIDLDTISNKNHLYGFGPMEYLTGELLIIDGISYISTVINDSSMKVEENYKTKAPFFAYANIENWVETPLPDSVNSLTTLENYLNESTTNSIRPFLFKLEGNMEEASIHIVNLPKGTEVHSPEDAHKQRKSYSLKNEDVSVIGFFSTEHKTIFTHHDTFLHMHLITNNKSKMGHCDEMKFDSKKMKLYLPKK